MEDLPKDDDSLIDKQVMNHLINENLSDLSNSTIKEPVDTPHIIFSEIILN